MVPRSSKIVLDDDCYWRYRRHGFLLLVLRRMISSLRVFAHICIWTTPLQIALVLWGIGIIAVTDHSIISLSNIEFIRNYLGFLLPFIEWAYAWFWIAFLDWVFSLPMILHQTVKAIVSTWLGYWILKRTKKR